VLRVGVTGPNVLADPVADALARHGIDVHRGSELSVALTVVVTPPGGAAADAAADVLLIAQEPDVVADAAGQLYRDRLAPWARSLASERPDVTAPPHLLEHDPAWPSVAARRCRALRAALGALDPADRLGLQRVDHVGSTAVPGLAAKPFLDLQVTLDRLPGSAALASALAPLGWAPAVGARPDSPGVHRDMRSRQDTADDDAFTKRLLVAPDPVHPGILHVRQTASPFARRVVRFRDQLRADTLLRRDYERLTRRTAAAHADDRDYDDYTRDKGVWLADVHPRVDVWAGGADDPWPADR
jgi:dephospho-CoA kinase